MKTLINHLLFAMAISLITVGLLSTVATFAIGLTFSKSIHDVIVTMKTIAATSFIAGIGAAIMHYLNSWRSSF